MTGISDMKNPIVDLNKLFESRVRLGVMSILLVNEWVEYNTLKEYLQVTDGNLASHLKGLESKKLIEVKKQFVGRKPKTTYRCTQLGKNAFRQHLTALENLIKNKS
jgi:DNA-binding HxlR family transcriptional regulator